MDDIVLSLFSMQMFGHRDVSILDWGLPGYLKAGGPTNSGTPTIPQPAAYKAEDFKAKELWPDGG